MFLDQDFTAKNTYTLEQKQRINTISEEIVMKSKESHRWQWATGIFGFYQWLNTTAPVTFKEDGMAMMDQMLGNFIPALVEVPMGPGRNMNIMPALKVTSARLPIKETSRHRF